MRIIDIIRKQGGNFSYPNMKTMPEKKREVEEKPIPPKKEEKKEIEEYEEECDL